MPEGRTPDNDVAKNGNADPWKHFRDSSVWQRGMRSRSEGYSFRHFGGEMYNLGNRLDTN